MGRSISVIGCAGAGQWPEHRTHNRHWFAIDWTNYKDETVGGERTSERCRIYPCLVASFVRCVIVSPAAALINRTVHLHPDR